MGGRTCPRCMGTGRLEVQRTLANVMAGILDEPCPDCEATGSLWVDDAEVDAMRRAPLHVLPGVRLAPDLPSFAAVSPDYLAKLEAVATASRDLRRTFDADAAESYVEAFQEMADALDALEALEKRS